MTVLLFVHFGPRVPKFIIENLNQTSLLFPELQTVFVSDAKRITGLRRSVKVLTTSEVGWNRLGPKISQDQRFWNGWWQKTFDRLLIIRYVHDIFPDESLLQVETDNLLFPSFPFERLESLGGICFPAYSTTEGIASIVFSSSIETSRLFEKLLISHVLRNPHTSDMHALGEIRDLLGSLYLELPEFQSPNSDTNSNAVPFSGCFDGASHGEWITGWDPKAHWGLLRRKIRTPVSLQKTMPKYNLFESQLLCSDEFGIHQVHNLHVHSKEFFFFKRDSKSISRLLNQINSSSSSHFSFDPKAFLFCLRSNVSIWLTSILSIQAWKRQARRVLTKSSTEDSKPL